MSRLQDVSGNALEYAIAWQTACAAGVPIKESSVSAKACRDFMSQPIDERRQLMDAAAKSVYHILAVEKSLAFRENSEVEMQTDTKGQAGDPRDVLLTLEKGALGISCKRNNETMKNPRLQRNNLNFWEMWGIGGNVSKKYRDGIEAVFAGIDDAKENGAQKWADIDNLHEKVYKPVRSAFVEEFQAISNNDKMCKQFVRYVVGVPDYYKIMAYLDRRVVVQGFNFNNKLSCRRLSYPKSLLSVAFVHQTTIILSFDGGWVFSMRIHNAETRLKDSLKWDIKLIGQPVDLYSHCILL